MIGSQHSSASGWGATHIRRAGFDGLLNRDRVAPDQNRRRKLLFEAQLLPHEEGGVPMMAFVNITIAAANAWGTAAWHEPP